MKTLWEQILPMLQAIHEEGGNFVSFQIARGVLDAVDAGAAGDASLRSIRGKIQEAINDHGGKHGNGGKRDHGTFSKLFEAYVEGVVLLAARNRGLDLVAVPDGSKHGKTPDLATRLTPMVGFEVKTLNVAAPDQTFDKAMNDGFEAGYEAEQEAKRKAALHPSGKGFGSAISEFAPHGEGVDLKGAIEQTMKKASGLVKGGQYRAYPTFFVASLDRLGVTSSASHLRQRQETDRDWDEAASGHLYAIAAHRLGDHIFGFSHGKPGVADLGPLDRVGVLRDHPEVAGMIFLHTIWHELGSNDTPQPDVVEKAYRFFGVWNCEWERSNSFDLAHVNAARQAFEAICHFWNDTDNSREALLPDLDAMGHDLRDVINAFVSTHRRSVPTTADVEAFMTAADELHFRIEAVRLGIDPATLAYCRPGPGEGDMGVTTREPRDAVLFSTAPKAHPKIARFEMVRRRGRWEQDDSLKEVISTPFAI